MRNALNWMSGLIFTSLPIYIHFFPSPTLVKIPAVVTVLQEVKVCATCILLVEDKDILCRIHTEYDLFVCLFVCLFLEDQWGYWIKSEALIPCLEKQNVFLS